MGDWDREPYSEDQDEFHASSIYSLLENEIVPMYYGNRDRGVPEDWMRRVKQSLMCVSPAFNCNRMVAEYNSQLYRPAHEAWQTTQKEDFRTVRSKASWIQQVRSVWDRIRFVEIGPKLSHPAVSGQAIPLRVVMDLAGLKPEDVRVEAVIGRVSVDGHLENTTVFSLPVVEQGDSNHVFARDFVPDQTGRLGYAVRVSANHFDDPLTRPCGSPMRWASSS